MQMRLLFVVLCLIIPTFSRIHHLHSFPKPLSPIVLIARASSGAKEGCDDHKTEDSCPAPECIWKESEAGGDCVSSSSNYDNDYNHYDNYQSHKGEEVAHSKKEEKEEKEEIEAFDPKELEEGAMKHKFPLLPAKSFEYKSLVDLKFWEGFRGKTEKELQDVKEYPVLFLDQGFNGRVYLGSKKAFRGEAKTIIEEFDKDSKDNVLLKIALPGYGMQSLNTEVYFYTVAQKFPRLQPWIPKYLGAVNITDPARKEPVLQTIRPGLSKPMILWDFVAVLKYQPYSISLDKFVTNPRNQKVLIDQWAHLSSSLLTSVYQLHSARYGFKHNDIQPSNLLVFSQNRGLHLKLIDFGVASWTGFHQTLWNRMLSSPKAGNSRIFAEATLNPFRKSFGPLSFWGERDEELSEGLQEALKVGVKDQFGDKIVAFEMDNVLSDIYSMTGVIAWTLYWSKASKAEFAYLAKTKTDLRELNHYFYFLREMGIRGLRHEVKATLLKWKVEEPLASELAQFIEVVSELETLKEAEIWPILHATAFAKRILASKPVELPEGFQVPDLAKKKFLANIPKMLPPES